MNIYHQEFVLLQDLKDLECWNYTRGETATFQAGETIEVCNPNDATHTTILCSQEDGRPVSNRDGTPADKNGYRFIVQNDVLSEAIGIPIGTTYDFVGEILAYENGELDKKRTKKLFAYLKKTGIGGKLQGHYSSRMG